MRNAFAILAALLLISGLAFAQATTQQPPSTGSHSGMSGMHHPPGHQGMMGGNMQEHMQQMKAALEQMKQNLEAMKADVGKMDSEVGKDYMEKNNQLWQQMVDHLDMMMSQMGNMQMRRQSRPGGATTTPKPPATTTPPQQK
jgi:hypothetical protein